MFLKMEDNTLIKKGKSEREQRKTETLNSSKNKVKDKTFNEVKRYFHNKRQQMKDNQNS